MSIVATVRNEMPGVIEWLDALRKQTLQPDEIIIVDGGSTDGSWDALRAYQERPGPPLRLVSAPGVSISSGRNMAIQRARGDVIAVTDAGTRADPRWLEGLIGALSDPGIDVASGFFVPQLDSCWRRGLAAATLPDALEIDAAGFLPSSRSIAFRATWFRAGIRYPEWLDYCEDLVWDLAMRRAGARFRFVPDAVVTFHVRENPRAYALQYYRYARGDGKAGLFARRHLLRYVTYVGLLVVGLRRRPLELLSAALLGALYVAPLVRRLWRRDREADLPLWRTLQAAPLTAALRALGDVAKLVGYPAGLCWRWKRYGSVGWRTSWRRITPSGDLRYPGASTTENRTPTSSRAA